MFCGICQLSPVTLSIMLLFSVLHKKCLCTCVIKTMSKTLFTLGCLGILTALYLGDIYYLFPSKADPEKPLGDAIFTPEELASFNGVQTPFLYLAVLGTVFNVTKGLKHYGAGQQYHFFVGRDASRNFITGQFEESFLSDDVSGLTDSELKSLNNWLKFYKKEYQKVGKLIGRYYDEFGKLTPYGKQIKKRIRNAEQNEQNDLLEKQRFPPCNVEWSPETGTRVWCTNRSGGIERVWIGRPRQYYEAGSKSYRCACIREENEQLSSLKEYPGCDRESRSCFVTD